MLVRGLLLELTTAGCAAIFAPGACGPLSYANCGARLACRPSGRTRTRTTEIQAHMAQKPVLRVEVGARALRVRSVSREEALVLGSKAATLAAHAPHGGLKRPRGGRTLPREIFSG